MAQLIENGYYFILVEILVKPIPIKQWEMAKVYNGHLYFFNICYNTIKLKDLIIKETPFVKIPDAEKLLQKEKL